MPTKTIYQVNELFDTTGMIVKATYNIGSDKEIINYSYFPLTFTASGQQDVAINYTEGEVEKSTIITVQVQ